MIHASIPAAFALAGVLVYALSANAKAVEIGRITFAAGLLVSLWVVAGQTWTIP